MQHWSAESYLCNSGRVWKRHLSSRLDGARKTKTLPVSIICFMLRIEFVLSVIWGSITPMLVLICSRYYRWQNSAANRYTAKNQHWFCFNFFMRSDRNIVPSSFRARIGALASRHDRHVIGFAVWVRWLVTFLSRRVQVGLRACDIYSVELLRHGKMSKLLSKTRMNSAM